MAKHYDRHYCGKCHLTLKIDAETAKKNLEELKKRQEAKKSGGAAAAEAAGGKKDAKKGKKGKKWRNLLSSEWRRISALLLCDVNQT